MDIVVAAPNGTATGTGSETNPLSLAAAWARSPEEILCRDGRYTSAISGAKEDIAVKSFNEGERPVFVRKARIGASRRIEFERIGFLSETGEGLVSDSGNGADNIRFRGCTFDQKPKTGPTYTWSAIRFVGGSRIDFIGCYFDQWLYGDFINLERVDASLIAYCVGHGPANHSFVSLANCSRWIIRGNRWTNPADRVYSLTGYDGMECTRGLLEGDVVIDSDWDGENPPPSWWVDNKGNPYPKSAGAGSPCRWCTTHSIFRNFTIRDTNVGKNPSGALEAVAFYSKSTSAHHNAFYGFLIDGSKHSGISASRNPSSTVPVSGSIKNTFRNGIIARCQGYDLRVDDEKIGWPSWELDAIDFVEESPTARIFLPDDWGAMTVAEARLKFPEVFAETCVSVPQINFTRAGVALAAVEGYDAGSNAIQVSDTSRFWTGEGIAAEEGDLIVTERWRARVVDKDDRRLIIDRPLEGAQAPRIGEGIWLSDMGQYPRRGLFPGDGWVPPGNGDDDDDDLESRVTELEGKVAVLADTSAKTSLLVTKHEGRLDELETQVTALTADDASLHERIQRVEDSVADLDDRLEVVELAIEENHPDDGNGNGDDGYLLGMRMPGIWRPFANSSPWNTPIPENSPTHEDSGSVMRHIVDEQSAENVRFVNSWNYPIWVIDSERTPRTKMKTRTHDIQVEIHGETYRHDHDQDGWVHDVPITEEMWGEPNQDGIISIIDPKAQLIWDMSKLNVRVGSGDDKPDDYLQWYEDPETGERYPTCTHYNKYDLYSQGHYHRSTHSANNAWARGAVSAGVPAICGVIRPEEVLAGEIRHRLQVSSKWIRRKSGGKMFMYPPAVDSDGKTEDADHPIMGMLFQLDPSLTDSDFNDWGLNEYARVVARCLQRYGAHLLIKGGRFKLSVQRLAKDPNEHRAIWDDECPGLYDSVQKIPVDQFRVVDIGQRLDSY